MKTAENNSKLPDDFKSFEAEIKVASPGRINLIGEHTDYNNGFVIPAAIDKKIYFRFRKNNTKNLVRIYSETFDAYVEFNLQKITKSTNSWENYLLGVIDEIQKLGKQLQGFDCILKSELPIGAGISSSAALECGFAEGLNSLFNLDLAQMEIVKLSQRAENNFVGSNCGIMDQFASVMSKKDHFIKLDCESLEATLIPAKIEHCKLLLLNTNVAHNLADSEYNSRRQECENVVAVIQQKYSAVKSLRQVSFNMLEEFKEEIGAIGFKRCQYVLEENERVQETEKALRDGNLQTIGKLMYASHRGLQHQYEVSCPELDFLVDFSEEKPFIYGSRMMGGGFGGCTINLIEADEIDAYFEEVKKVYQKKFDITPTAITVVPDEGTQITR
ncbi:galactokinase [Salegentibacter mishustinae]|uniref:Galactokinase n=1 Tax=Salegentibacter mishustinae TaxID=270918 RepID=A0A0Q9ZH62_9FLAO|nr:galactokinase [Salegentibacter mishustinae]KRG28702.1 galactokinase [Salegentibacter mishustinae]PNW22778.1 galactokinase [Salegentibacter mishustinae]PZX67801.1 galactokinase [Salegentibacter mishustinae]